MRGQNHKFKARSRSGILVGYCTGNAYRILLDGTNKVMETKNVTFFEEDTPQTSTKSNYLESELDEKEIILDDLQQEDVDKGDVVNTPEYDVKSDEDDSQIENVNDETHIQNGKSEDT